jgi:hypothetical protein
VDPVLGGEVVEGEEHVGVIGDLGDRLGPLRSIVPLEGFDGGEGVVAVLGVSDLCDRPAGSRLRRLRQRVEHVLRLPAFGVGLPGSGVRVHLRR